MKRRFSKAFPFAKGMNDRAQMPFSLAAVVILLLSSTTAALVFSIQSDEHRLDPDTLREMNEIALRVSQNVEELAYSAALSSFQAGALANESQLNSDFQACLRLQIEQSFPEQTGPYLVSVNETNLALLYLRTSFSDLYPSLPSDLDLGDWSSSSVPTYFTIYGNFTITILGRGGQINKMTLMDNGIYCPLPFLLNRLDQFSNANSSDLDRLVRSELSALVQDRILRGYGAGSLTGQYGTQRILSEEDVSRALIIALLFQEKSVFRCIDPSLLSSQTSESTADVILERLSRLNGSVDPVRFFLSTYDEGPYDLGLLVSQCLYASVDIITLRWLEYLGVISSLTQEMEESAEKMVLQLSDVFGSMLGRDLINESAVEWVRKTMSNAGYSDMFYRYLHYSSPDILVTIPKYDLIFYNDHMEVVSLSLSGTFNLDLPPVDLLSSDRWKAFASNYISNSYQLADSLRSFLKAIALSVGQSSDLPALEVNLETNGNQSFLEEMERKIESALRTGWCSAAVEQAKHVVRVQDAMSAALLEFLHSNWEELYKFDESLRFSCNQVAQGLLEKFIEPRSDFGPEATKAALQNIFLSLYCQRESGGGKAIEEAVYRSISGSIGYLEEGFGGVSLENSSIFGSISKLAEGAISSLPGIEEATSALMIKMMRDMETSASLRGDGQNLFLASSDEFPLLSFGSEWQEGLEVSTVLRGLEPYSDLRVSIRGPDDYDPSSGPNLHFVERGNLTLCPFSNQWEVKIDALLETKLSSSLIAQSGHGQEIGIERSIPLSMSFTLCGFSGWPLEGVSYHPSTTLAGDIEHAVEDLLNTLSQGVKCVTRQIGGVASWLQNLESTLSSFAILPLQAASSIFLLILEGAQGFLSEAIYELLQTLADFLQLRGQTVIKAQLFGLRLTIYINPADISLGTSKDLLRFDVADPNELPRSHATLRLLRLSDGSVTALFNASMAGNGWTAAAQIDPWMKVREHMVELTGVMKGTMFELNIPEVVEYRSLSLSLSDIPIIGSILGRIPSPIPGTTFAVDAGFELRCSSPVVDHVVINELEQNPTGNDRGREWIELFNPTPYMVDLRGWTVRTSHGDQRMEGLGQMIKASSFLVIDFENQMLDNGGSEKFPLDERIALYDGLGREVDSAPWVTDYYNDQRTWQREVDGGHEWVFKNQTRGERNGPISLPLDLPDLRDLILDAAEAAAENMDLFPSLESLINLIQRTIANIMNFLLDAIERSMVELSLFVDLSIRDGTGVMGAGVRAGLRVGGEVIADGLRWMLESAQALLQDPTNPGNQARSCAFFEHLLSDTYVWISIYGGIQLPKCLSKAIPMDAFRCSAVIEANLNFFSRVFTGENLSWRLNGGVVLSGVPTSLLSIPLSHPGESTDIWLFKASLYSQV